MIRMTMTKPTIDSAQVNPESFGRPMNEKTVWKLTISQAMTHSSGASTVSSIRSSVVGELFVHRWGDVTSRYTGWSPMCSGLVGGRGRYGSAVGADRVRNVVDATGGPRVAAQQPAGSEP